MIERIAPWIFVTLLAACASTLPVDVPPVEVESDDDPPLSAAPTMIEYPPIEPVEPPIEPARAPAPQPAPAVGQAPAADPAAASTSPTIAMATPAPAPVQRVPPEDLQTLALLADLQRFGGMGADDLRRELAAATTALGRDRSDANRVRLAVLYTLTRASPQDDQRALQLLENVAKSNPGPTAIKQLAAVLQLQVVERLRAVRDEQAKANDAIQKLEALRAIERALMRDRVGSGGGGGGGGAGGGGSGK